MQAPRGIEAASLAAPSRSRPGVAWALLFLVALIALGAMAVFFFQRQDLSDRLAGAEQRLGEVRTELAARSRTVRALQGQLRGLREDLAVTVRTVDRCRDGLRDMINLWNQHTAELDAARSGSSAELAAAHERTETARRAAEAALRQCQG
jgi:septal ring factor EnvC (AmiA/AmiB activator)